MKLIQKPFSQRGAMFGMDARIALAIFGAVAVIAGYIGISKLVTAKEAALVKELNAISQATQQAQTDVGTFYLFALDGFDDASAPYDVPDAANAFMSLADSTNIDAKFRPRWNGPYLDITTNDHRTYGSWKLVARQEDDVTATCDFDTTCSMWIQLDGVPGDMFTAVNRYIDENGGSAPEGAPAASGRVRTSNGSVAATNNVLMYRTGAKRASQ